APARRSPHRILRYIASNESIGLIAVPLVGWVHGHGEPFAGYGPRALDTRVRVPRALQLRPRQRIAEEALMNLVSTPLLPEGYKVPASRNESPSKRLRRLLAEKPYVFAPGVYDPMGAQLVMYHGFDAVYFSGYSFAIGHLGTTDMDLYSSVEIADGARRTVSALRKFQLTMAMGDPEKN